MSNYPDDIRMYDNDSRSPFYSDPETYQCDGCDEYFSYEDLSDDYRCDKCWVVTTYNFGGENGDDAIYNFGGENGDDAISAGN